ncbi:Ribosomal RNA small subunit methyltransferase NEP1 [Bienertia sinuspersici]
MDAQKSEFKQPFNSIASCQLTSKEKGARVIFVLENASLHKSFVRKTLRAILDSPLNKAGMVGAVYVKTDSGVIINIKPHTRIPRTLKRFCGIMVELLEKSCVRAKDSGEVLIQVLKEPLALHLPENASIIGLSYSSEKLVDVEDYLSAIQDDDSDLVFVVLLTIS